MPVSSASLPRKHRSAWPEAPIWWGEKRVVENAEVTNPQNTPSSKPLVPAAEVGKYFNVSARTILNWAYEKKIPVAVRMGRVVRFNLDDVRRQIEGKSGSEN